MIPFSSVQLSKTQPRAGSGHQSLLAWIVVGKGSWATRSAGFL